MLKDRANLIQDIQNYFDKIVFNKKKQDKIIRFCADQFNYPEGIISDYLRGQKDVAGSETGMLYILSAAIDDNSSKNHFVKDYFTNQEKEVFSGYKYEDNKSNFPLKFKMISVSVDSWVGAITAKELIRLYQSQLINYNANTQRALKYIFRRGETSYRVDVNRKAVREIADLFESNKYISNTLTLNIPPDEAENDFYYNNQTNELVINNIKMFDILDGYHRLLGIFEAIKNNPDFDYPMELRITTYDDTKAKQFIYQEDQKTKMKKVQSDAYNVYSFANRVIAKLNADPLCDIQGLVTMSGEHISQPWLGNLIENWLFYKKSKTEGRQIINDAEKCLVDAFNSLIKADEAYLNKRYSYIELVVICYYSLKMLEGKTFNELGMKIISLIEKLKKSDDVRLQPSIKPSKTLVKYLDTLVED